MLSKATQRQIDAFQLFLYACDMNEVTVIKAVKFRGTYYKFKPDLNIID